MFSVFNSFFFFHNNKSVILHHKQVALISSASEQNQHPAAISWVLLDLNFWTWTSGPPPPPRPAGLGGTHPRITPAPARPVSPAPPQEAAPDPGPPFRRFQTFGSRFFPPRSVGPSPSSEPPTLPGIDPKSRRGSLACRSSSGGRALLSAPPQKQRQAKRKLPIPLPVNLASK